MARMPGVNLKLTKFFALGLALLAVPLLAVGIASGAASDAPATGADTVVLNAPNNMIGDPVAQPISPNPSAQILRGEYLATAGDCQECHSVPGQPAYSGGLAMPTPVGAVYSPNITSSKPDGIGNWTDQQFWNALHFGISPGHSLLVFPRYMYPSMPYDATSKLSYDDVMAIKAYLESIQPADITSRPTGIPFPLNTRAALLGWRIMFFRPNAIQYDASWSPSVRNGAYLVQALAHCSDCHTPRNLLFASENDKFLSGGHILGQSWYAPNITSDKATGVGGWNSADLVQYLSGGGRLGTGAIFGPMQQVVADSLSRLPASDVQDIANYLQTSVPAMASNMPASTGPVDGGAQVYAANCARCHGAAGEGVANNFPNLAANQSIWNGPSDNIISMVIGGFYPWHQNQSAMPAFRAVLTDDQIAAVTNYVRTSWGNQGSADATGAKVSALRAATYTEIDINTGTAQASLAGNGAVQTFNDISGHLTKYGSGGDCQLQAHFAGTDGSVQPVDVAGACVDDGFGLRALVTVNGKSTPMTLALRAENAGSYAKAVLLSGKLPDGAGTLNARIALVTPNE
jgi:cbb3-type cytochrome c oxidase subunit III